MGKEAGKSICGANGNCLGRHLWALMVIAALTGCASSAARKADAGKAAPIGLAKPLDDPMGNQARGTGDALHPDLQLDGETALSKGRVREAGASATDLPAQGASASERDPLLMLGPGDVISMQVYGRPEMTTTTSVADDGSIEVPLVGRVQVAGRSPSTAAETIADVLKKGQFLVNPQVTITLAQFRSQQVSVLGEVNHPGRFPVESTMTVLDLVAQAGGVTENGSDEVTLIRRERDGSVSRHSFDLKGFGTNPAQAEMPSLIVKGGDSVFIPRANQYYVYGEVQSPNMYRLEPDMTVVQAIARSGGVTVRGSINRIEINRRNKKGALETVDAKLSDLIQVNDVIRVKERIF